MPKPKAALRGLLLLALLLSLTPARAAAPDDAEPLRVGVYMDLSGHTSSFGESSVKGIRMAAEEINEGGGIGGRRVTLFVEDDTGSPDEAVRAVRRLIEKKVHAILGEVVSSNSLAGGYVAQVAGVPMVATASTNPRVTQLGDYIFRTCFIDPAQGEALARFAFESLKARRAAVLADINSDYSKGIAETFRATFGGLGGVIAVEQTYAQTDSDFRAQLLAVRRARPDVILVPGYYGQAGPIARQARRLGLRQPLLGGDGWDAPRLWQLGGAALNGSYMSNHYSTEDPAPANQKFIADYRKRYGRGPDAIAALAYDSLRVLADAAGRAGTADRASLRDAIARTRNFRGVTGTISLDADRNAIKPVYIFELREGKFIYRRTVPLKEPPAAGR